MPSPPPPHRHDAELLADAEALLRRWKRLKIRTGPRIVWALCERVRDLRFQLEAQAYLAAHPGAKAYYEALRSGAPPAVPASPDDQETPDGT